MTFGSSVLDHGRVDVDSLRVEPGLGGKVEKLAAPTADVEHGLASLEHVEVDALPFADERLRTAEDVLEAEIDPSRAVSASRPVADRLASRRVFRSQQVRVRGVRLGVRVTGQTIRVAGYALDFGRQPPKLVEHVS